MEAGRGIYGTISEKQQEEKLREENRRKGSD
jgi:hypothetical protein